MRRQQRYDVYDTSRFFSDGAVVQAPPAHTISRDLTLAATGAVNTLAFSTGMTNGTDIADVPPMIDDRVRATGREHFMISCAPCHGAAGFGGGPIAPNLSQKRPPSLRSPGVEAMPAGTVFRIITSGIGRMPPYGWQLAPAERWGVVAYVRSLKTLPVIDAAREDSGIAAGLQQLDSLRGTHADLKTILRLRARGR